MLTSLLDRLFIKLNGLGIFFCLGIADTQGVDRIREDRIHIDGSLEHLDSFLIPLELHIFHTRIIIILSSDQFTTNRIIDYLLKPHTILFDVFLQKVIDPVNGWHGHVRSDV